MDWKEIRVLTDSRYVEAVAAVFHSMASGGVAIEDWQAARVYNQVQEGDQNLSDLKSRGHDFVVVKAYFHEDREVVAEVQKKIQALEELFGVSLKIYLDTVKDEDWE